MPAKVRLGVGHPQFFSRRVRSGAKKSAVVGVGHPGDRARGGFEPGFPFSYTLIQLWNWLEFQKISVVIPVPY